MATAINQTTQPLSSGEFDFSDPDRYGDIERETGTSRQFFWCASDMTRSSSGSLAISLVRLQGPVSSARGIRHPAAALFITPDARVVIADNVDSGQLFDKQLGGLGLQLKQRPWHAGRNGLLDDLCRGRNVALRRFAASDDRRIG